MGDQPHVDRPGPRVGHGRGHGGRQAGVRGQREVQSDGGHGQGEVHLHRVRGDPAEALRGGHAC